MAFKRMTIDGNGQVELNNVAFRRDGRIVAQYKPTGLDKVENGMLLAVDGVNRTVKAPGVKEKLPIALVYSTEHMYDERANGLKDFALKGTDDFLPRLGYLAVGDTFHDNCLAYNDAGTLNSEEAVLTALKTLSTPVYGGICENGAVCLDSTEPIAGPVLKVIEKATMPDGQFGLKFQVIDFAKPAGA